MRDDLTDITILLDRSGSMASLASDVVGGINQFIKEQRDAPGDARLTLVQFDTENIQEVFCEAEPIQDARSFGNFSPRGGTPLWPAMGKLIGRTGDRLAAMPEDERPGKVVFVVFTDGQHNSEGEFSAEQVREMVKHQTEKYQWYFTYMGAHIAAFSEGHTMGLLRSSTAQVAPQNTSQSWNMLGKKLAEYRTTDSIQAMSYSEEEQRELAAGEPPQVTYGTSKV